MRYLLSESSASILRGLAADRGGVSFEDRRIDRASPARPRPFACRVAEVDSATHMLCYLPPLVAQAIRWEDAALAPQSSLGSVDSPWVDLGSWTPSQRVWLAIAPPVDPPAGSTSGGYAGGWALVLSAAAPTSLSGHAAYAHLVAAMESGTSGASRFVQYHLGSMLLAGGDGCSPTVDLADLPGTTGHPNGGVRITVTPCEGTATSKDVYNGNDGTPGADGCTPTVTAGTTPSEHGDLACTITPCGEGATPIPVYHGKNGGGTSGASGTFRVMRNIKLYGDHIVMALWEATVANGVVTSFAAYTGETPVQVDGKGVYWYNTGVAVSSCS